MVEAPSFAAGGGKMGVLLREHDWSRTPLSPLETWPQSLRTTVGLILRYVVPIVLLWGEDGIMIYNDAYSVFAGGHHPGLFGSKVREGWPEVADFNDNVMKVGLAGGTLAYQDQELTLYRTGRPEQVWMNLDYSPVPDERGEPAGVIAIVVETTARVLAERRQAAERERQRAIFQQMPGFVGVLAGPEHVFEYVNDAYVAISGPRTFVGRSVRAVFPELEGQGFYELLDEVYATGKSVTAQAMPLRLGAESDDRYIDFVYEPLRDDGRNVTGIFVGGYDVTDRMRAEARRETLVRLTDKSMISTSPTTLRSQLRKYSVERLRSAGSAMARLTRTPKLSRSSVTGPLPESRRLPAFFLCEPMVRSLTA
jgi:PAS domain-containing protein